MSSRSSAGALNKLAQNANQIKCWFLRERGKLECQEKNLSVQSRKPTNSRVTLYRRRWSRIEHGRLWGQRSKIVARLTSYMFYQYRNKPKHSFKLTLTLGLIRPKQELLGLRLALINVPLPMQILIWIQRKPHYGTSLIYLGETSPSIMWCKSLINRTMRIWSASQVIWWRNLEDWEENFYRRIPQPRAALGVVSKLPAVLPSPKLNRSFRVSHISCYWMNIQEPTRSNVPRLCHV